MLHPGGSRADPATSRSLFFNHMINNEADAVMDTASALAHERPASVAAPRPPAGTRPPTRLSNRKAESESPQRRDVAEVLRTL